MKAGIHPEYKEVTIKCACGETVTSRSTKGGEMRVEICSKCHPFFTGKQKFVDAGGRLDKFKKRLEASKSFRPTFIRQIGQGACKQRVHCPCLRFKAILMRRMP